MARGDRSKTSSRSSKPKARATKRKAKPAAPKKRKLSTSPEAKRARAYRAQRKAELAAAAAKAERAKKKRSKAARARRAERESIELGERERKREARERAKKPRDDERQLLIDVLEEMRNNAAAIVPMSLDITEAEIGARIPWLVVGRFDCVEPPTYAELDEVFASWRDDVLLEARIHPQRLSQIRIVYTDPKAKRGEGDSIVSHTGPWEAVISEITFELDPSDEDSLANRYEHTTVPHFYVYFSGRLATEVSISL